MKTAIITGVNGQDGSYLAQFLLERNYKVIGVVRTGGAGNTLNLDYLAISDKIILEIQDLTDIGCVKSLLIKYKPDEMYNLAAQSSVGLSFEEPLSTVIFNTNSVFTLLEAIRLFSPLTRFYQAASSEMFGQVQNLPVTLDTKMNPISPYAVSKMVGYQTVKMYRESYGLFACSGVLFNHESFLRKEDYFIKKVIVKAIELKAKKIDRLVLGNLNVRRDFGYAPKYVEAMWRMLQIDRLDDFMICSGVSILLRDIVEYVFYKLELDKNLIIEDSQKFRVNEISDLYGNNQKAKEILNWHYNYSFYDILDILIAEELNVLHSK